MISKLKQISQMSFIRNVIVVMSGTALAQIITFSLMPIITRLYGPEPIGVLGAFNAVISILTPIVALTYPIAIVLPKEHRNARKIAKLSVLLSVVIGVGLLVFLLIVPDSIIDLFNLGTMSNLVYLLPVMIVLTALVQIMDQWLIRTHHFKVKAQTAIAQSAFMNGSKVITGLVYPLSAALVIIQTISVFFRALLMYTLSDKSIRNKDEKHTLKDLREVAKNHQDFPKYRAPQSFINAFSQGLPVLMFTALFGPAVAGFYSLGRQALNTPVQLIGNAVQDVFYPKINELVNEKRRVTPLIMKSVLGLLAIGILPFGIIILFGPEVFSLFFGVEWVTAGEYARWIGLVSLVMLITRPIIVSIPVLAIQRNFLVVEIVGTAGKIGSILAGLYFFDEAIYAVAFFSIASVLMYVYLTVHTLIVSSKIDKI